MSCPEAARSAGTDASDPRLNRRFGRARNRKGETLAVAQRLWRCGPAWFEQSYLDEAEIELRPEQPIKHYTKILDVLIDCQLDDLRWEGHGVPARGRSQMQIQRVIDSLIVKRWKARQPGKPATLDQALDQAWRALMDILETTATDVWDVDKQTWVLDPERQQRIRETLTQHPFLRKMFRDARKQVQREHRAHLRRGRKLGREMAEGRSPRREQLRKTVHQWQRDDLLPRTPPRALMIDQSRQILGRDED